jgi:serine/threonine protein kinase
LNLPYDLKVDVFALGALLLELYLEKEVFRSASNLDQLYWIVNICGYPAWSPAVMKMREIRVNVPHTQANLPKLIKGIRPEAQDIITKMLSAVPGKRLSIF